MIALAALGVGALSLTLFGDAFSEQPVAATSSPAPALTVVAATQDEIARTQTDSDATQRDDADSVRIALALPGQKTAQPMADVDDASVTTVMPEPVAETRVTTVGTPASVRDAQAIAAPLGADELQVDSRQTAAGRDTPHEARRSGTRIRQALVLPDRQTAPVASLSEPPGTPLELVIARGDTLDQLFATHGLNRADLARILRLADAGKHLSLLRPGDRIALRHDAGSILVLDRVLDEERLLRVTRNDPNGFATEVLVNPVERRRAHAHGVIESSLFRAAQRAGVSDTLIMELAGVFAWDIDFVLDIRRGDSFTVLYEEIWQDGEKLRDGEILAAEFVNDGDTFRAVRFVTPDGDAGYYTPDGHNVKKAFLRAPIAITPRVTSNFNPRRLHPVHKKVRPHRGVDYGAPSGTPIKAAGDGKVIFRGRKGGYGNTVILQHGGNITTLYAHMSRFHKRSRVGARVKQGQIIGYVGATGTVTAAHLHYEYRVGGVHRNPRTVKLPKAQPVASQHRDAFVASSTPLLQRLDVVARSWRVASADVE